MSRETEEARLLLLLLGLSCVLDLNEPPGGWVGAKEEANKKLFSI